MSRFYSYQQYLLLEKEVELSNELTDYTVQDLGGGKFEMKRDNAPFLFSVVPVPDDIDKYQKAFYQLIASLKNGVPSELYKILLQIQNLPYKFGNLFNISLTLSNIGELELELTPTQHEALKISEEEFLKKEFTSLPKHLKDSIISYFRDLAEKSAVVLECLFYYTRTGPKDQFFHGEDFNKLLDEYSDEIKRIKEKGLKIKGPFKEESGLNKVDSPSDYVFWFITIDGEKYILRCITSPKLLRAEDNVGKKMGLTCALLNSKGGKINTELSSFSLESLEKKLETLSQPQ